METQKRMDVEELVNDYFQTLNELDEALRIKLIQKVWAAEGTFVSSFGNVQGHKAIDDLIGGFHQQSPQTAIRRTTDIEVLHANYLRFGFEVVHSDSTKPSSGIDFATVEDGKLKLVAGFLNTVPHQDVSLTHQEIINIAKQVYQAFNAGDTKFLTFFAPTFEWHAADNSPMADRSPYRGLDKVRNEVIPRIAALFPRMRIRTDEILATENKAIVLGYYYNLPQKEGGKTEAQVAHILTFENGKIVKFQQYTDTYKFASL
jgi:ketosteroid isomerase-like protein